MEDTDKLIAEQLQRLPPEFQKAIESVPWKSLIKEIALLNEVPLEKVVDTERETMFIIYGFENPADYIDNLIRETGISEAAATNIAEAVNEKIFKLIATKAEELSRTQPAPAATPVEKAHDNLPMVEKREVAHEVPHIEATNKELGIMNKEEPKAPEKPKIPDPPSPKATEGQGKPVFQAPKSDYPGGKDPYREPLV